MNHIEPTYLRFVYDKLEKGILNSENPSSLPDGFVGIYEQEFVANMPVNERQNTLLKFGLWSLFKAAVSLETFSLIFNIDQSEARVFIDTYSNWFNSPEPGKYQLYHDRIKVFFLQKLKNDELKELNEQLIIVLLKSIKAKSGDSSEQYALEHLSSHMALESMMGHEYERLHQFVNNESIWRRQIDISNGYEWSQKAIQHGIKEGARRQDELNTLRSTVNSVKLMQQEQNSAEDILRLLNKGDYQTALKRAETWEGERQFKLYLLMIHDLTLGDCKEANFKNKVCEILLQKLKETSTDIKVINTSKFFSSFALYKYYIELKNIKLDASVLLERGFFNSFSDRYLQQLPLRKLFINSEILHGNRSLEKKMSFYGFFVEDLNYDTIIDDFFRLGQETPIRDISNVRDYYFNYSITNNVNISELEHLFGNHENYFKKGLEYLDILSKFSNSNPEDFNEKLIINALKCVDNINMDFGKYEILKTSIHLFLTHNFTKKELIINLILDKITTSFNKDEIKSDLEKSFQNLITYCFNKNILISPEKIDGLPNLYSSIFYHVQSVKNYLIGNEELAIKQARRISNLGFRINTYSKLTSLINLEDRYAADRFINEIQDPSVKDRLKDFSKLGFDIITLLLKKNKIQYTLKIIDEISNDVNVKESNYQIIITYFIYRERYNEAYNLIQILRLQSNKNEMLTLLSDVLMSKNNYKFSLEIISNITSEYSRNSQYAKLAFYTIKKQSITAGLKFLNQLEEIPQIRDFEWGDGEIITDIITVDKEKCRFYGIVSELLFESGDHELAFDIFNRIKDNGIKKHAVKKIIRHYCMVRGEKIKAHKFLNENSTLFSSDLNLLKNFIFNFGLVEHNLKNYKNLIIESLYTKKSYSLIRPINTFSSKKHPIVENSQGFKLLVKNTIISNKYSLAYKLSKYYNDVHYSIDPVKILINENKIEEALNQISKIKDQSRATYIKICFISIIKILISKNLFYKAEQIVENWEDPELKRSADLIISKAYLSKGYLDKAVSLCENYPTIYKAEFYSEFISVYIDNKDINNAIKFADQIEFRSHIDLKEKSYLKIMKFLLNENLIDSAKEIILKINKDYIKEEAKFYFDYFQIKSKTHMCSDLIANLMMKQKKVQNLKDFELTTLCDLVKEISKEDFYSVVDQLICLCANMSLYDLNQPYKINSNKISLYGDLVTRFFMFDDYDNIVNLSKNVNLDEYSDDVMDYMAHDVLTKLEVNKNNIDFWCNIIIKNGHWKNIFELKFKELLLKEFELAIYLVRKLSGDSMKKEYYSLIGYELNSSINKIAKHDFLNNKNTIRGVSESYIENFESNKNVMPYLFRFSKYTDFLPNILIHFSKVYSFNKNVENEDKLEILSEVIDLKPLREIYSN